MSRKKKKQRLQLPAPGPRVESAFLVGQLLRVAPGTPHPTYPDIPLGGWQGTVLRVDASITPARYELEWTSETLAETPLAYDLRTERDDLDPTGVFLPEASLVADDGTPLQLEKPTLLQPRPLNLNNPQERALSLFGLTLDDPLPPMSWETLKVFHAYLSEKVQFPVPAAIVRMGENGEKIRMSFQVEELLPLKSANTSTGLQVRCSSVDTTVELPMLGLHVDPGVRAGPEMRAYIAWALSTEREEAPLPGCGFFTSTMAFFLLVSMAAGATLMAVDDAHEPIFMGAAILGGLLGLFVGFNSHTPGSIVSFFFGLGLGMLTGGLLGGVIGAIYYSFWHCLIGGGLCAVLAFVMRLLNRPSVSPMAGGFFGVLLALVANAIFANWFRAVGGIFAGIVVGGFFCLIVAGGMIGGFVERLRRRSGASF